MEITIPLTDEETEALRAEAALQGRSMEAVARAAILEYLERRAAHHARVGAASREGATRYAEVLRRLGAE